MKSEFPHAWRAVRQEPLTTTVFLKLIQSRIYRGQEGRINISKVIFIFYVRNLSLPGLFSLKREKQLLP
jgi:hypothetical protein